MPVLPLGNISLGLALLYAALAAGWLLVTWREPRVALIFVLGPLLAPLAALGLLPLAVLRVRPAPLRALTVVIGVLTAALACLAQGLAPAWGRAEVVSLEIYRREPFAGGAVPSHHAIQPPVGPIAGVSSPETPQPG